ncbi:MAG: hypothetical protein Q9207_006132 [Kuettlingeria erythrocarpa]
MRHSSIASLCALLACTTALPTSLSSPLTNLLLSDSSSSPHLLPRQDGSTTGICSRLTASTICFSNYGAIPISIICSTSTSTSYYAKTITAQTVDLSAGDVVDEGFAPSFLFSPIDQLDPAVVQADPLIPPTYAAGCDASKPLYWSPMIGLGNSRSPFPVDIGVFNVEGEGFAITAAFCGVMTNSGQTAEGKNRYQICNAAAT